MKHRTKPEERTATIDHAEVKDIIGRHAEANAPEGWTVDRLEVGVEISREGEEATTHAINVRITYRDKDTPTAEVELWEGNTSR